MLKIGLGSNAYESIDGFVAVLEVLCIIDSVVVLFCDFLSFWILRQKLFFLGQEFSGLMYWRASAFER